ncbi:DUF1566 domain-containing protein [Paraburkholderia sp.]|uniref:DUF1566 domain-containing protein n=1 Tax=Paraburkholderia sp. TaxID=1926495 RepID=UPI003C7D03F5
MSEQLIVPRLGTEWEGQGGIYAGLMRGEGEQPDYHLIVSVDEAINVEWGGYGINVPECDSRLDGAANTRALLASTSKHPAAAWAAEYTRDGHSDFYLPAQRELNLCYATVAEKFAPEWYWSSTQYSAYGAWVQYFGDGLQYNAHKINKGRFRAVRRLVVQ